MNRKLLPPVLMLIAGLITSIRTFYLDYDMKSSLITLLVVLIVFYILGSSIKYALDVFERQNEQRALDEGEVIEKAAEDENTEGKKETEDSVIEE